MWMRVGGRYSRLLAWVALLLLLVPGIVSSIMLRSVFPMAVVLVPIVLWVLAALVAFAPILLLRALFGQRPRRPNRESK